MSLPYTDTKPVGAADFYLGINATFRFILQKFGVDGLRRYWTELGTRYYAPVTTRWQQGLPAVADYWREFFAAEPGAEVAVTATATAVTLDVKVCPAFRQLRVHGREVVPCFCEHCHYVSAAIGQPAGINVKIEGGNGSCRQVFSK